MIQFNTYLLLFILFANSSFKKEYALPLKLEWLTHYKGKPNYNIPYLAITATDWEYRYRTTISQGKIKIDFTHKIILDVNRSWVKMEKLNDEEMKNNLLNHEQGHINIQQLLLNEANRSFKAKKYSVKNFQNEIKALVKQINAYYAQMHRKYDLETEHGTNATEQAKWDTYILSLQ